MRSTLTSAGADGIRLDERDSALLGERIEGALALSRRAGAPAFATLTVQVDPRLDAVAAVLAARRPEDRWSCLVQPARGGQLLAALGAVAAVETAGGRRFETAAAACRELGRAVVGAQGSGDPQAPPGSGPVFTGGFSFGHDGGGAPEWAGFEPVSLVLPELSFAGRDGRLDLTANVAVGGDESAGALLRRVEARLAELCPPSPQALDTDPLVRPRVAGAAPPSHYEEAVRRAVERIRAGELEKIVLAREVRVHGHAPVDPAPVFAVLREAFPECYCYCVGNPHGSFIGASPELLVRREGAIAQTVALAGTTRRSADPAVDDHLGQQLKVSSKNAIEHEIVARRIERELEPVSVWVTVAPDPVLVKVQNVQHLATPIRAQLAEPVAALELAGRLHPTPAVGGEPSAVAEPLIPALEGFDRGWYAGGVGWTDLTEDGEFCVALRCALLHGEVAHLYAGCGIVGESDPAEELAESESKLAALLPLLS